MDTNIWFGSRSVEWYTPKYVFDALDLDFDLDPCSPPIHKYKTRAANHYVLPKNDGLIDQWFGKVWCNPPFGKGIDKWVEKMYQHNNGVLLVNVSALPNRWFHKYFDRYTAICFIKGRINFINGIDQSNGAPAHGQMLISFGNDTKQAVLNCNLGVSWDIK